MKGVYHSPLGLSSPRPLATGDCAKMNSKSAILTLLLDGRSLAEAKLPHGA